MLQNSMTSRLERFFHSYVFYCYCAETNQFIAMMTGMQEVVVCDQEHEELILRWS